MEKTLRCNQHGVIAEWVATADVDSTMLKHRMQFSNECEIETSNTPPDTELPIVRQMREVHEVHLTTVLMHPKRR